MDSARGAGLFGEALREGLASAPNNAGNPTAGPDGSRWLQARDQRLRARPARLAFSDSAGANIFGG